MKTININGKDFTIEELSKLVEDSKNSEYPVYCQLLNSGKVVKFTGQRSGILVKNASNGTGAERVGQGSSSYMRHNDEKIWKPIPVCLKTGFFRGQLVWAWDDDHTHFRVLAFYDVENSCLFSIDGRKNYLAYDNYLPFEGNWPDWALEAYETLEL